MIDPTSRTRRERPVRAERVAVTDLPPDVQRELDTASFHDREDAEDGPRVAVQMLNSRAFIVGGDVGEQIKKRFPELSGPEVVGAVAYLRRMHRQLRRAKRRESAWVKAW